MALNFSQQPIFPVHLSEDNLNEDVFSIPWHPDREDDDIYDWSVSQESGAKDIVDLLPSDPFGMDISSAATAITGWLEDLEVDCGGIGGNDELPTPSGYESLYLKFICSQAYDLQNISGVSEFSDNSDVVGRFDAFCTGKELGSSYCNDIFWSVCNAESAIVAHSSAAAYDVENDSSDHHQGWGELSEVCFEDDFGNPHDALPFVLGYLGVRDLLSVQRVCKSLHSTVLCDSLLWRSVYIDHPLNERITDDVLLQLTSRSQGNLRCLSLKECQKITDVGLRHVIESNPKMTKLCVPGCTRLSIDGIITTMNFLKHTARGPGIQHLRIGGLFGITSHHFAELQSLLGIDNETHSKPRFYRGNRSYLSCDDERAIDIEMCPKCSNLRLVYDCPSEKCLKSSEICRGCILCVQRCVECGRCVSDGKFEETFCLDLLCGDCLMVVQECG